MSNNADVELLATLGIDSSEPEIIRAIRVLENRLKKNANGKLKLEADIDIAENNIKATINKLENILKSKELSLNTKSSIESITKEANAMLDVMQSARKAADEKLEFAKANEKVRRSADGTADAITRERNAMNQLDDIDYILNNITRSGQDGNSVFQRFGSTLREAFYAYSAANLLQDAIYKVIDAGEASVEVVKELNDVATSLRMATGDSQDEIKQLLGSYVNLGRELGAITSDVSNSADAWLRQGHSIEDTNELIADSMMLSKIANLESAESTEFLTSIMNAYDLKASEVIDTVSRLSAVDLESASDAGGLAKAMSRCGSAAEMAGVSMDTLIGYIATVKEVTQDSDEAVGNMFKSVFSRMNQIRAGKFVDLETGESLNDTEKVLNKIGIVTRDLNNQLIGSEEILNSIGASWNEYDSNTQKALATAVAGTYQYNKFIALMQNYADAMNYANISANSQGVAEEKFGYYLDSLEAKTNSLKASLENLVMTTISDELYASVLDTSRAVVDLTADAGTLKGLLAGLGTAGSIYAFQQLTHYLGDATQGFANLSEAMSMTRNGTVGINDMQRLVDLTSGLSQSQTRLLLSTNHLTDAQKVAILMNQGMSQAEAQQQIQTWGVATAQNGATTATVTWSGALRGLWAILMANPLILVTAAVSAGVMAFTKYKQSQEEAAQATKEASEKASTLSDEVSELASKYISLSEAVKTDSSAKEELLSTQSELIEKLGLEGEGIDKLIEKYGSLSEAIKQASLDSLKESQLDLISGVDVARDELLKSASGGFAGQRNAIRAFGDDAVEAFKILEKANLIDASAFGTGGGTFQLGDADTVDEAMANYKRLEQALEALRDSLSAEELTDNSLYKGLYERYNELKDSVEGYNSSISNLNRNLVQQKMLSSLQGSELPKTQEHFETFRQELIDTAVASDEFIGTEQEISNAVNNYLATLPEFKGFYSTPLESELDLTRSILKDFGLSKDEMFSQLNDMSEGFESLGKIYESISDGDSFDFKLLDDEKFKSAFSELGNIYTDFAEQVASTPNDINACQSAFDNLVTEWIKSLNILEGVTEENANLTISMLEQMGVANAQQIVDQMFTIVNEESQIINDAEEEFLATYQNYLSSKDEADLAYLESSASKNGQLISALGEGYQQDYKNWCDLLSKKAEVYNALVKAVGGSYNSAVSTVDNLMANGITPTMSSITAAEAAKGQYQMLTEAANKAKNSLKLDLSTIKTNFGSSYKPTSVSGGSGSSSSKSKETTETFDWIKNKIEAVQRVISNLGKTVSATYKSWTKRNSALSEQISKINEEISVQQQAYAEYTSMANGVGLSTHYQDLVKNGALDISTITDETLVEKIKSFEEFYNKAIGCQDTISDLNEELAELARTKFDNLDKQFKNIEEEIQHEIDMVEGYIDQTEAKGYIESKSAYESLIKSTQKNVDLLTQKYSALVQQRDEAMSIGKADMYSDYWYELTADINSVESALQDANTVLIEYNNSLRELEWDRFDYIQKRISSISKETEFILGLLSEVEHFDDKGNLTDEGQAVMGLHTQGYNVAMNQADQYAAEIEKLNKELEVDPNNQTLLERREQLLGLQRESIELAKEEQDAIMDLVQQGIDKQIEAMETLAQKYKDTLHEADDLYDFQKKVENYNKEIASLEKQLSAWQGDDSEEAKSKIQQIRVDLEEAKENREEAEREQYIRETEKLLDSLVDEYTETLNGRMDDINGLMSETIRSVNENALIINETLQSTAESVGYTLSEEMQNIWSGTDGIKSVVSMYGDNFNTNVTTVNNTLLGIKSLLESMVKEADKDASDNITEVTSPSTSTQSTPTTSTPTPVPSTPSTTTTPSSTSTSSAGTIKIGGRINASGARIYDYAGDTSGESQYYKSDPYYIVLDERNNYLKVRHHSLKSGVTGWFKKSDVKAYKTGGLVDKTGLAWLDGTKGKPEMVLDAQDTENLIQLKDTLREVELSQLNPLTEEQIKQFAASLNQWKPITDSIIGKWSDFIPNNSTNSMNNVFNMNFELHEVQNGREVVNFLIKDKSFENAVKAMTVDQLAGRSKFAKNKYVR